MDAHENAESLDSRLEGHIRSLNEMAKRSSIGSVSEKPRVDKVKKSLSFEDAKRSLTELSISLQQFRPISTSAEKGADKAFYEKRTSSARNSESSPSRYSIASEFFQDGDDSDSTENSIQDVPKRPIPSVSRQKRPTMLCPRRSDRLSKLKKAGEIGRPSRVAKEQWGVDITEEQVEELRSAFNLFDSDGSGAITALELRDVMASLGMIASLEDLQDMIAEVDEDDSGKIEFSEFVRIMATQLLSEGSVANRLLSAHSALKASMGCDAVHRLSLLLADHIRTPTKKDRRTNAQPLQAGADQIVKYELEEYAKRAMSAANVLRQEEPGRIKVSELPQFHFVMQRAISPNRLSREIRAHRNGGTWKASARDAYPRPLSQMPGNRSAQVSNDPDLNDDPNNEKLWQEILAMSKEASEAIKKSRLLKALKQVEVSECVASDRGQQAANWSGQPEYPAENELSPFVLASDIGFSPISPAMTTPQDSSFREVPVEGKAAASCGASPKPARGLVAASAALKVLQPLEAEVERLRAENRALRKMQSHLPSMDG